MATLLFNIALETVACCQCGMTFAMPSDYNQRRLADHKDFYCPAGHSQHYTGKSEAEKLRDQLAREKHLREQAESGRAHALRRVEQKAAEVEHLGRRINGYKGAVARTKRRIAAGRCVCCSKKFKDLEQHMRSEHPNWSPETHADKLAAKGGSL